MKTALRHSEDPYKKIFETSTDAIMLLDKKGFTDCNKATLRMFGCKTKDEFCGKHPSAWSPPKQPGGFNSVKLANQQIAQAYKNGRNFFEWIHRKANGQDFPAEVLLTPLTLNGKKVVQATVRDVSERKKQEENYIFLSSIIENSDDAILSKDLNGKILSWNHGAEILYQYEDKEIIGKNVSILLPEDRKDEVKNILNRIKKKEKVESFETIRVRKNGSKVNVSVTISPITNTRGEIIGAGTIARNITKEKEKAAELEKMNKLMVGRELKMVELKEKIAELENRK